MRDHVTDVPQTFLSLLLDDLLKRGWRVHVESSYAGFGRKCVNKSSSIIHHDLYDALPSLAAPYRRYKRCVARACVIDLPTSARKPPLLLLIRQLINLVPFFSREKDAPSCSRSLDTFDVDTPDRN